MSGALLVRKGQNAPWLRDPLWTRARSMPSLDLDFAGTGSLRDRVSGQNLVTFTRASSGTYVDSQGIIRTATTDAPRITHDPTTGKCLGLLVEEARTNLLRWSEVFDSGTWGLTGLLGFGSGSIANAIAAPNGTVTADLLTEDTTTATHATVQANTIAAGSTIVASVYVKPASGTRHLRISVNSPVGEPNGFRAYFDLSQFSVALQTAAFGAGSAISNSANISSVGNGWYRISCAGTVDAAATSATLTFFLQNTPTGTAIYTGDGTSGLYLWGAQLEAGSFPTSYIPTADTAATRAADIATITGTNFSGWYRQDEGTFFASYLPNGVSPSTAGQAVFAASNDSATDRLYLAKRANADQSIRWASNKTGAANIAFSSLGTWTVKPYLFAGAYRENDFSALLDGANVVTDNTVELFTGCDIFTIGMDRSTGASPLNGTISRLTFWPRRLPDPTLQALTR